MSSISNPAWLTAGALAGYGLMMWTNPVRASLGDGWRAVRRYPALWLVLGVLGCANALWTLGARAYLAVLFPGNEPAFVWVRAAWRDPRLWLSGSPESLWWLPRGEFTEAVRASFLPALENLAGLFHNLVSTFPLAALAAPLACLAWRGRAAVLLAALRRRYGWGGWLLYAALVLAALAALAKPFLYAAPQVFPPELWLRWGQVLAGAAFIFEYLLGTAVQVFLLLLAFAWVRGLNFQHGELLDVAVRRSVSLLPWSGLLLLLAGLLIEAPLVLKNFPATAAWFPSGELFAERLRLARTVLAACVLLGAGLQLGLTLHAGSLRRALRDWRRAVARAWWPLGWFLIIAAFHFLALHVVQENIARGVGEGTALWVVWRLASPWLAALLGAWLLASWVCVYKRHAEAGTAEPPAHA
jgi:hypothetical protein